MTGGYRPEPGRPRAGPVGWLILALAVSTPIGVPVAAQNPEPVDPVAQELDLGRGILDFEQGRYGQALDRLNQATPEQSGATYYRGLSLLALDRPTEALGEFDRLLERPEVPDEVALDLGMTLLDLGDAAGAEAILARYVDRHPGDPFARHMYGLALERQGRIEEAEAQRHLALGGGPDAARERISYEAGPIGSGGPAGPIPTPLVGSFGDLGQRVAPGPAPAFGAMGPVMGPASGMPVGWGRPADRGPSADRRWNLTLLSGYEYDTNVALAPSIPLGGLGFFDLDTSRWTLASFAEYRLVQRPNAVLGLIGSTYNTWQFELDEFNVQDYMGGAYGNVAVGNFILGNRYEFHETLLDQRQFTQEHRLTPNLTYLQGNFGHLTTYYEYINFDVEGFALVPAQIRSATVHAVGATQAIYLFQGAGRLFLGYRYDEAFAEGSDFDRRSNMITGRIEVPLPWQIVANAEFRQFWDDYQNPNSLDFFGRLRSDRRTEARAGFQKFLGQHLSFRLEYVYIINDSNVENLFGTSFYSFDRHLLSTLLIYDF
ncbi:hypothetical protein BH23PLA1_BH23PLA1_25350 [soil metagenome]